jgi:hypothetical protein
MNVDKITAWQVSAITAASLFASLTLAHDRESHRRSHFDAYRAFHAGHWHDQRALDGDRPPRYFRQCEPRYYGYGYFSATPLARHHWASRPNYYVDPY